MPQGSLLLEARRSRRRSSLKTFCVLQTIGSPRHGLEPLLLDRSTIDHARAERAILHAAQRIAHLLQHIGVVFGLGEFL